MLAYVARRYVILVVHTHIVVLHFHLPKDFSVCPKDEKLKFLGGSFIAFEPHGVLTCHHCCLRLRGSADRLLPVSVIVTAPPTGAESAAHNLPDLLLLRNPC